MNWARRTIASLAPLTPHGPEGSISPNPNGPPSTERTKSEEPIKPPENIKCLNSYVENRGRVFHEDIPIPGSNMTLHYASNRVDGFHHEIMVPASGETVPDGLKRIIVKVEVAGRTFEQTLDPSPNQKAEFMWDGLDSLGRRVTSPTSVKVNIGFVYDGVYTIPPDLEQAFAMVGQDITSILTRQEATLWEKSELEIAISPNKTSGILAEGWTLSSHHQVSPMNPSYLYKGDGTIINNNVNIIKTVAGNGNWAFSGDGGPAVNAGFFNLELAVNTAGNILVMATTESERWTLTVLSPPWRGMEALVLAVMAVLQRMQDFI